MKGTLITILVILGLGVIGYFFYDSLSNLGSEQTDYDFTPAEVIQNDSSEEELQTEIELGTEIESQESQEAQAEEDFNNLETLNF